MVKIKKPEEIEVGDEILLPITGDKEGDLQETVLDITGHTFGKCDCWIARFEGNVFRTFFTEDTIRVFVPDGNIGE